MSATKQKDEVMATPPVTELNTNAVAFQPRNWTEAKRGRRPVSCLQDGVVPDKGKDDDVVPDKLFQTYTPPKNFPLSPKTHTLYILIALPGPLTLSGYCYTGNGRPVNRIEVSVDSEQTWLMARKTREELTAQGRCYSWVLWECVVPDFDPALNSEVAVRAFDSSAQGMSPWPEWNLTGRGGVPALLPSCQVSFLHKTFYKNTNYRNYKNTFLFATVLNALSVRRGPYHFLKINSPRHDEQLLFPHPDEAIRAPVLVPAPHHLDGSRENRSGPRRARNPPPCV